MDSKLQIARSYYNCYYVILINCTTTNILFLRQFSFIMVTLPVT